jgi:hypothetical protein
MSGWRSRSTFILNLPRLPTGTPTWGNTVMSQISTHPELFQSHQRGTSKPQPVA